MYLKYKRKKIAILLLSIICLIALQVFLYVQQRRLAAKNTAQKTMAASPSANNYQYLIDAAGASRENLSSFEIHRLAPPDPGASEQDEGGAAEQKPTGFVLRFGQEGGDHSWKLLEPDGIPILAQALSSVVSQALNFRSRNLLDNLDLSSPILRQRYGFDEVWLRLDYFDAEGKAAFSIEFGAAVPARNAYYAMISGSRQLFMVSSEQLSLIKQGLYGLRSHALPELKFSGAQNEQLELLEILQPGSRLLIAAKTKEDDKYPTLNELSPLVMKAPYSEPRGVDIYQVEQLLKSLPQPIRIFEYINDEPNQAELGFYGLVPSQRRSIEMRGKDGSGWKLYIGKEQGSNRLYAMQEGFQSVFTVDKGILAVFNYDAFKLADKFVALINISKVAKVSLRLGSETSELSFTHSKNEQGILDVTGGKIGATELEEKPSKEMYQEFLNVFLAGEIREPFFPVSQPEAHLIYSLLDGSRRDIRFYAYPARDYYAVSINNERPVFLVERAVLSSLNDKLKRLERSATVSVLN